MENRETKGEKNKMDQKEKNQQIAATILKKKTQIASFKIAGEGVAATIGNKVKGYESFKRIFAIIQEVEAGEEWELRMDGRTATFKTACQAKNFVMQELTEMANNGSSTICLIEYHAKSKIGEMVIKAIS